jgi:hypothetical protein
VRNLYDTIHIRVHTHLRVESTVHISVKYMYCTYGTWLPTNNYRICKQMLNLQVRYNLLAYGSHILYGYIHLHTELYIL